METHWRGVSYRHDGHAGQTVVGTTGHKCPLKDTWEKMETLIRGVSNHHDDRAGWTVVGTMVRHKSPS